MPWLSETSITSLASNSNIRSKSEKANVTFDETKEEEKEGGVRREKKQNKRIICQKQLDVKHGKYREQTLVVSDPRKNQHSPRLQSKWQPRAGFELISTS